MKFKKDKCNKLHLGQSNPKHKYRLGEEWLKSSLAEKDLGLLIDEALDTSQQCALGSQIKQPYPGLQQKMHGQHIMSPAFLSALVRPHLQY